MADKEDLGFVGIPDNSIGKQLFLPSLPDFSSFAVPPELPKITIDLPVLTPDIFTPIIDNMLQSLIPNFPNKPSGWDSYTTKQKLQWLLQQAKLHFTIPDFDFDTNILQDCLNFLKALIPPLSIPSISKEDLIKILKSLISNLGIAETVSNIQDVINAIRVKVSSFEPPADLSYNTDKLADDILKIIKAMFPNVNLNLQLQQIYLPLAKVLTEMLKTGDSLVTKYATTYPNISFLTTNTQNKKLLFRIKLGNELRLYDPNAPIHWEYYLRMKNCVIQNYLKTAVLINYVYTGVIQSVPPTPDPLVSWQARIKGFKKDLKENYDNFQDFVQDLADMITSAQIEPVIPTCKFQQEANFNSSLTIPANQITESDNLYEDNLQALASAIMLGTMTTGINPTPIVAQNLAANSSGMAQMAFIVFVA